MACCKGEEYGNWCEDVNIVWTDPETGEEYCLFHAPAEHKWMNEHIIERYVDYKIKTQDGCVNLEGSIFTASLKLKEKIFKTIQLSYSTFHGSVAFSNCQFSENLIFNKISTSLGFKILNCTFSNSLYFTNCTLALGTLLGYNDLTQDIEFIDSDLGTGVLAYIEQDFKNLTFAMEDFSFPTISIISKEIKYHVESIYFILDSPNKDAELTLSNLAIDQLSFAYSINAPIHIQGCDINSLDTLEIYIDAPALFDACSFNHLSFTAYHLKRLEFINCSFPQKQKRSVISDSTALNLRTITKKEKFKEREDLYRRLKKRAQDDEARLLASDWHYWEKYFCEKKLFTEGTAIEWLILRLYRLLSDYGESVGKASCWLLIFILTPLLFSYLSQLPLPASGIEVASIAKQGLDYIPLATRTPVSGSWPRFLQLFWQALITFQATLLGFALRNRYRR
ncbi:hypothetical protein [Halodesulfovibrio sp. MK-HDV]|jgi:hypothetical protein|uniref:hypothetical protein n=1 Tax=Halodesulfovibrio sp. MK-HDV TaxID=2599925 RepID=UPI00136E73D4|nr:hypothetical protein [Halodesulfovibrio sp. MK-HDV]KAF1074539.1 hypothetical protein MKHDV_02614 [Halodesulfovibrio sp. MK-HDV]